MLSTQGKKRNVTVKRYENHCLCLIKHYLFNFFYKFFIIKYEYLLVYVVTSKLQIIIKVC